MSFNDFVQRYNLKNKATSNIEIQQMLKKMGLDSKVRFFLKDGGFLTNSGILNLQPSERTPCV